MRTQKRFTPAVLERFERIVRGIGIYENYVPWHRVGRSDPASSGRSHLQLWRGRHRELLSDIERVTFFFSTMLPDVVDIREQFPLSREQSLHELSAYVSGLVPASQYPGTIDIAKELLIKHPRIHGGGRSADWVMTTDLLLTLADPNGRPQLLAVAVKPDDANNKSRTQKLLSIERVYWEKRGVHWLLITPEMHGTMVSDTLRNSAAWAMGAQSDNEHISFAASSARKYIGKSLSETLRYLAAEFCDMDVAQRAFWQAVWCGQLPLDLRRGWRPHEPIILLDAASFQALNPVASRRSA